jgi:NADPH:quinone reductase-like Zn-dependent oxidoreductase
MMADHVQFTRNRDESNALNTGDDIAGIVESVGSEVFEYKPGDRVAAFHRMGQPHGGYAPYAIAPASTTFLLPPNISFESGAGLPLAFITAAIGLYQMLGLPLPTTPGVKDQAVLIYGGASAVGAFALKLAKLSGIKTIITVAGSGIDFVKSLDAATHIIDYRKGAVPEQIAEALESSGQKLSIAFDAISGGDSYRNISAALVASSGGGLINMLDPVEDKSWKFPDSVKMSLTFCASAYGVAHSYINEAQAAADAEFSFMLYRLLSLWLAEGRFQPHPIEVIPNGIDGILDGVKALLERRVSAKKLVARLIPLCVLGRNCSYADHFRISDSASL